MPPPVKSESATLISGLEEEAMQENLITAGCMRNEPKDYNMETVLQYGNVFSSAKYLAEQHNCTYRIEQLLGRDLNLANC